MVIAVNDPELEARLAELARQRGTTPEALALDWLRQKFVTALPFEPRDDWERQLLASARDYGVSLSNDALSREAMYE
jgi:aryl-alcohol dehydrogenase-like predicted oxidoreductase